jgi:hypothetical protein
MAYVVPKVNGIVGELSDHILKSTVREYREFAVASAMQIVAACAQGTWRLPDGRPICLYQLVLAPASSGKGAYLGAVKRVLAKVSEQIVSNEPGSREGLRQGLQEWNSRTILLDEVQDFFKKLGSDNPHIQGIGTDLKEVWSGVEKLQSISTKTAVSDPVKNPLIGFYGAGTIDGTAKQFCGDTVGGGLFSRFQVFFSDTVVEAKREVSFEDIPNIIGQLYAMFHQGKTEEWKNRGFPEWMEYRKQLLKPVREIISPQMFPTRRLKITKEADDELWMYRQRWEADLLADPDSLAGAVWDRAATAALMYAALHCLGCRRTEIDIKDVHIGVDMAGVSASNAVKLALWYASSSEEQNDIKKVLRAIKRHVAIDRRTICRVTSLTVATVDSILINLQRTGDVICTHSKFSLTAENQ